MQKALQVAFVVFILPLASFAQTSITSCQTITSPGTYVLQNDVSSPDTCFLINSDNVTLNLNGHTVRYADRASESLVTNAGFESGSGAQATSWDMSSASAASRTSAFPSIRDRWVKDSVQTYSLKFASPASAQYVYSQPVSNVQAGTIHVLSTLLHRHRDVANYVKAWVISSSGAELCGTSYHTEPGIADRSSFWSANDCPFVAQASDLPVRVKVGVSQGFSGDAYFDAIEVRPGNDYDYESINVGISRMVGIRAGRDDQPARNNIRITNGSVIQGAGKAYFTRAVTLTGSHLEVDNLNIVAYGPDSTGINLRYPSDFKIHNNQVTLNGERIHFSHAAYAAAIQVEGYGGGTYLEQIYDNTVHRSPGTGIMCSRARTDIYNNTINVEASSIHSYGISAKKDSRLFHNTIRTTYGSGIFLEGLDTGDGSGDVVNTEVFDNYVEVRDCPHEDYEWTGKAFWTRYRVGNLNIHDNTFIGFAGKNYPITGMDSAVSTVRLGANDDSRGPFYFRNNIVEAYTNDSTATYYRFGNPGQSPTYAVALDMNVDSGEGVTKYIENNTIKSNHIGLLLGGDYAQGNKARLKDNLFVKAERSGYPVTSNFSTVYVGLNTAQQNVITDSPGQNGADPHDIDIEANYNTVELDLKSTLLLQVRGSDGRCLQGAAVTVTNPSSYFSSLSTTSDNGGSVSASLLDRRIRNVNQVRSDDTLPAYTITAVYSGQTRGTTALMNERREISLLFEGLNGNVTCSTNPTWTPGGSGSSISPEIDVVAPSAPLNLRVGF